MTAICAMLLGCAAPGTVEEQPIVETGKVETATSVPAPEITVISASQEGVITKLRGMAYIKEDQNEEFIVLRERNIVPVGKIFYLEPRTTMKIEQESGEEIYLYSKEEEAYYKLERK